MSSIWTRRAFLGAAALAPAGYVVARHNKTEAPKLVPGGGHGPAYFPNVELTTHEGEKVHFFDDLLRDRFVVVNFMYTVCEGICTGITQNLKGAQRILGDRVGRDIFMYSITLKPEEDDPATLAKYVREQQIGPGWKFLTGSKADLERLRRKLGFTDPDPKLDSVRSQHTGMVKFGDVPKQRWAACPGQLKPELIAAAIVNLTPISRSHG
jgi:protein SCO1